MTETDFDNGWIVDDEDDEFSLDEIISEIPRDTYECQVTKVRILPNKENPLRSAVVIEFTIMQEGDYEGMGATLFLNRYKMSKNWKELYTPDERKDALQALDTYRRFLDAIGVGRDQIGSWDIETEFPGTVLMANIYTASGGKARVDSVALP